MTFDEAAKLQLRFWKGMRKGLLEKYKAGDISEERYLERSNYFKAKIEAVESIYRLVDGV